jgi:hypothetical protein
LFGINNNNLLFFFPTGITGTSQVTRQRFAIRKDEEEKKNEKLVLARTYLFFYFSDPKNFFGRSIKVICRLYVGAFTISHPKLFVRSLYL